MTSTAYEQRSGNGEARAGTGSLTRWSAWEIGTLIAAFVVFWPLGFLALFLKWKNGEFWKGSSAGGAPWAGFKTPDMSAWKSWKPEATSYGFTAAGSGNAAFDAYKREQLQRLDEERRKLEDEQKAFRDFVEKVRRAKDQEEFDRFMSERNLPRQ